MCGRRTGEGNKLQTNAAESGPEEGDEVVGGSRQFGEDIFAIGGARIGDGKGEGRKGKALGDRDRGIVRKSGRLESTKAGRGRDGGWGGHGDGD